GFVPPALGAGGLATPTPGQGGLGPGGPGPGGLGPGGFGPGGFGGAVRAGGFLNGTTVSAATKTLLESGSSGYRWVAATVDANNAASYQLATGQAIMAVGGFNGTDPSPTLAQFERDVAAHRVHYFIAGGGGGIGGGPGRASGSTARAITSWVTSHFSARTVGGVTLYDLSAGQ
ncbi:MAG TPA: glycosyl transferase, partial [Acidimicrobiia bacterium]|nr:glycosyl transferase [Acidimicrobiia bacterium]